MSHQDHTIAAGNDLSRKSTWLSRTYLRHSTCVIGLAASDLFAFALAARLFRIGTFVPSLEFLHRSQIPSLDHPTDLYVLISLAFVLIRYLAGDYGRRQLFWDEARLTAMALAMAAVPDFVLSALATGKYLSLTQLGTWGFLFIAIPSFRQTTRLFLARSGLWNRSTALLGSGTAACDAFEAFSGSLSLGFDVRYLLTNDASDDVPPCLQSLGRVALREPANIVARLIELRCEEVVVALEDVEPKYVDEMVHRLVAAQIGVALIPSLGKLPLLGLSTNYFFGRNLLLLQTRNNLSRRPGRFTKRAIDLVGSLGLLILLSPLLTTIAALLKRANGGPVFFVQSRVGLDGRSFDCIKFRTMAVDAEEQLARWKHEDPALYSEYLNSNFKLRNDPRVTPIGSWLRRFSLDELPQLINVLRGEMSLVGPRPLLAREISEYGIGFEFYRRVRPGVTGLWQISGRSETRFVDRVAFDEWYIKNWSLWYDFVILVKTAGILFSTHGAY